jgi:hypothetical protein
MFGFALVVLGVGGFKGCKESGSIGSTKEVTGAHVDCAIPNISKLFLRSNSGGTSGHSHQGILRQRGADIYSWTRT